MSIFKVITCNSVFVFNIKKTKEPVRIIKNIDQNTKVVGVEGTFSAVTLKICSIAKLTGLSLTKKIIYSLSFVIMCGLLVAAVFICMSVNTDTNVKQISYLNDNDKVINNGGLYVKYKGIVYYREYTADDIERSAIADKYGNVSYPYIGGTKKNMVCLYPDGTKKELFKDTGTDRIYLYKDRFYLTESVNSNRREPDIIYSIDMNGANKTELGKGFILAVSEELGIIICGDNKDHSQLFTISVVTGEITLLSDFEYFFELHDSMLYFSESYDKYNQDVVVLNSISLDNWEKKVIVKEEPPRNEFMEFQSGSPAAISNIQLVDDYIYMLYGIYGGPAGYWQGGNIARVKKDGTAFELLVGTKIEWGDNNNILERFYIENTGSSHKLYYYNCNDDFEEGVNSVCLSLSNWSEANSTKSCTFVNTAFKKDKGISVYTDNTGEERRLINYEDYKDCGLGSELADWKENILCIKEVEIFDGWVYYKLESGVHDQSTDIANDPLYNRKVTKVFRKDLGSGDIVMLMSY